MEDFRSIDAILPPAAVLAAEPEPATEPLPVRTHSTYAVEDGRMVLRLTTYQEVVEAIHDDGLSLQQREAARISAIKMSNARSRTTPWHRRRVR